MVFKVLNQCLYQCILLFWRFLDIFICCTKIATPDFPYKICEHWVNKGLMENPLAISSYTMQTILTDCYTLKYFFLKFVIIIICIIALFIWKGGLFHLNLIIHSNILDRWAPKLTKFEANFAPSYFNIFYINANKLNMPTYTGSNRYAHVMLESATLSLFVFENLV